MKLYQPKQHVPPSGRGYEGAEPWSTTPWHAPYEQSFVTMEQFPGRRFWTFGMFAVLRDVGEDIIAELFAEEWEPWNAETKEFFLLLENQFAQTLIVEERAYGFRYWAQTEDLSFVRHYPVFLTYETGEEEYSQLIPPQMVIGATALLPEGASYHRYTYQQLGEQGQRLYERIQAGMLLFPSDATPTEQEKREREKHRLAVWIQTHQAAQQLAQLYWEFHEHLVHPTTPSIRTLPDIPLVIDRGALITSSLPLQAIIASYSNAQSGANRWEKGKELPPTIRHHTSSELPTFEYRQEDGTTWLQLRPSDPDLILEATTIEPLWEQVRHLSDSDGDVLLTMIAQAIAAPHDEKGCVWITCKAILDYRGVKPIMKKEKNGHERRAGHRQEDMAEVARCIKRMTDTWVTIEQWIEEENKQDGLKKRSKKKQGKTLFTHDSRLLLVLDEIRQHELQHDQAVESALQKRSFQAPLAVAWRYQLGSWLDPFLQDANYQVVWLLQQVLHYDHYHQMWEKRLARYFTFHLRLNAAKGSTTITRSIGQLIEELSLPINQRDPEKTRQRFDRALKQLETDGIISSWNFLAENPKLPSRKWLETWLTWNIQVAAAPLNPQSVYNAKTEISPTP